MLLSLRVSEDAVSSVMVVPEETGGALLLGKPESPVMGRSCGSTLTVSLNSALLASNWMSTGVPTVATGKGRANAFTALAPSVRKSNGFAQCKLAAALALSPFLLTGTLLLLDPLPYL